MDESEQNAAVKNFLRSMTQQQQERQMEEALVNRNAERARGMAKVRACENRHAESALGIG